MNSKCEWCLNPNADEADSPELLCDDHAAEFEGISVDQLHTRDRVQYAEYLDSIS